MCGERTVELKIYSPPPTKLSVNDDSDKSSSSSVQMQSKIYISALHKMSVTGFSKLGLFYSLK